MKKQFLIFAAITTIVFTSCTKEKIEAPQTNQPEEIAGARGGGGGIVSPSLGMGLIGRFEFDGNLDDMTGQIKSGTPVAGTPIYGADRKGVRGSAISFNEKYGVIMNDVPLDSNMSISFWMKYDMTPEEYFINFVEGTQSFAFQHRDKNKFQGGYWNFTTPAFIISKPLLNTWHQMAATRDNNTYKFYIDGKLVGSTPILTPGAATALTSEYMLGFCYNAGYKYWKGSLDDLRIYNRVISATEVQALFNL
jgi:hypothetical protein